nr:DUF4935 domain-containing protein [Campylobacter sp.]
MNLDNEDVLLSNLKNNNIKCVILDTNVFYSAKFNYTSKVFRKFLDNTRENNISIYITDIIKYEILNGIRNLFNGVEEKILSSLVDDLQENGKAKKYFIEKLEYNFENLIKNENIKIINCYGNTKDILDLFFDKKAPFSHTKPNEFRDAINLLTIKNMMDNEKFKNVIFVSNDKECCEFCQSNNIRFVKTINEVSNIIVQQKEKIKQIKDEAIKALYNLDIDKLKFELEGFLYSGSFDIQLNDNDIKIVEAKMNNMSFISADELFDDKSEMISISMSVKLDLKLKIKTPIYEHGPTASGYDRENDKFYYVEYKQTDFYLTRSFEDILFNVNYYFDDELELEQDTDISIFLDGDIDDILSSEQCEIIEDKYV